MDAFIVMANMRLRCIHTSTWRACIPRCIHMRVAHMHSSCRGVTGLRSSRHVATCRVCCVWGSCTFPSACPTQCSSTPAEPRQTKRGCTALVRFPCILRAAREGGRGPRPHRPVTLPARSCFNRTRAKFPTSARRTPRKCGVNPHDFTRIRATRREQGSP